VLEAKNIHSSSPSLNASICPIALIYVCTISTSTDHTHMQPSIAIFLHPPFYDQYAVPSIPHHRPHFPQPQSGSNGRLRVLAYFCSFSGVELFRSPIHDMRHLPDLCTIFTARCPLPCFSFLLRDTNPFSFTPVPLYFFHPHFFLDILRMTALCKRSTALVVTQRIH